MEKDIRHVSAKDLSKVDILTAGFPCQPFSQAGHGKGFGDERGRLFFEVPRLLKELKPKAYFLENVRTLSTHNKGETLKNIQEELSNFWLFVYPIYTKCLKTYQHTTREGENLYCWI